jgi:beta-N-acetylglucosaminidase
MDKKEFKIIGLSFTILLTVYSLFVPLLTVLADSGYTAKLTTGGVRFRSQATTDLNSDSSNNIIDTLDDGTVIKVLSSTKVSGNGCSEGWLNISYNNQTGYVCSKYVTKDLTDSFERPWNTPKKAIIGGAKWIAAGYINAGQFTSYLKKFNVNPNASYDIFNHQYQTNVMAPFSEALTAQKSYWNANMQDLSFTFNIPVYEEMADSYACSACKSVNLDRLDTIEDTAFEAELDKQGFPASYRPYLRALHKEHNNWQFIAMHTNLKFSDVLDNELGNNYIYIPSDPSLCLDGKCTETNEKNWYYASREAIAYFMDPRNVLNESYVFQFNSLEYYDYYTESLLNTTLKNTFMEGNDFIDNQSYASIFIEAGKSAGVNPLYLASLALQENSSKGSVATTGDAFNYNNIDYSGLFNFFNIGAYGDNPVRKGLIYASGGFCTICATYSGSNTSNSNTTSTVVTHNTSGNNIGVTFSGNYVKGFGLGTSITDLQSKDGNVSYSSSDIIATGTKLTFADGTSFTAVIYGDLTGDGKINSADLLKMRQYLLGSTNLDGAYNEAANIAGNGTINSANLLKLRQYLLGNSNISQS